MSASVEFMIALRYLRSRQSTRFASFISGASLLGVAIGVAALITILSVMNGLENNLRSRLLGMQSQATLTAAEGQITDWRRLRAQLLTQPRVERAVPVVSVESMANVNGRLVAVLAEGLAPELEAASSGIRRSLISGSLDDLTQGSNHIVLGRSLALNLGVVPGDSVVLLVPQPTVTGVVPILNRLQVSGIFESEVPEYDQGVAYLHWQDAASLLDIGDNVSALRLNFDDVFAAPQISQSVNAVIGDQYQISDWTEQNASYFRAIKLEKTMMALMLSLVIGVAAFNIVASLVMVVTDKETDIAILRTLGLAPNGVVRIFLTQGLIIGWFGVALGVGLGVLLTLNITEVSLFLERVFGFSVLPGDVYVSSDLPSELRGIQVFWIALIAALLTTFATLYPARRAARVHPAEALRYG